MGLRLVVYRPQGARSRYVHPRESVALSAHGRYIARLAVARRQALRVDSLRLECHTMQICRGHTALAAARAARQAHGHSADRRESAPAAALLAARGVGGDQRHYGLPAAPDARIYLYRTSDPVAGALPAQKGCRGAILPCRRHGAAGAPLHCGVLRQQGLRAERPDHIQQNDFGQGIDVRGRYAAQCHIRPRRREAVAVGLSALGRRAHRGAHSAERPPGRRVYGSGARGDEQA